MSATTATTATIARPTTLSTRSHRSVFALQILLALFMTIPSAGPKLFAHSSATEPFDKIGFGDWFMYLTGGLELAGAIALVIPLLSGVSAIAFMGLMTGAFITQLTVFDGENAYTPVILFFVFAGIAWVRRNHTAELVALLRKRL